jgi:hypothetical protein
VVTGDDDPLVPPANSFLLASRIRRARLILAPEEGHLLLFDDNGHAHPAIREFLLAPTLAHSRTWQDAREIDAETAAAAIRERGFRPVPWGFVNMMVRRKFSPPGCPS